MRHYRFLNLMILVLLLLSSLAFRFERSDRSTEKLDLDGTGASHNLPALQPWSQSGGGWLDSKESAGIAYFVFQSPARIERYDIVAEVWLTSIPLSDTPTAFGVDTDGLYISFGRRTSRFALDGSGELHLRNTDSNVQSLFTMGQFLYIHYGSILLSVNKLTGEQIGSTSSWYGLHGLSVAPSKGKAFARTTGVTPADIMQVVLNSDGTLGGVSDSPYHGDYPNASKTFTFPNGARVVDSAGIVYNTSDLTYSNSFGGVVDDIAFYGDLPIIRRGNTLIAHANTLLETGRYTPADPPAKIYVANNYIYSFSSGDTRGVRVAKIPITLLTPSQPGQPVNPNGLAYTPDSILLGQGEIVYLLSRTHLSIFRWSIAERRYLDTIPLVDAPSYIAYSAVTNRLYMTYAAGRITQIRLNESTGELPFANSPQTPQGLATAGEYLFVTDPTGAWDSHFTYSPDGALISQKDWNYYSQEYIWSPANRKMYFFRDDTSPNDLIWEDIAVNGTIGAQQDSPYHDSSGFVHPIRVAPDGSVVVLGSGRIYNATTLAQINTLSNNIEDATWGGGNLFTLRTFNSNTQVQRWGTTYGVTATSQVPGTPLKLLTINEGLLVVTNFYGLPRFLISDLALNKIYASPTLIGLTATNSSPTTQGQATNLRANLMTGVGPITFVWAFGNEQSGTGQQISYTYPAVGIYTAVVTASNPADVLTATTTITITHPPITGLTAMNNSPTAIGQATTLSAMVTGGGSVNYVWAFGDGAVGSGRVVTHTYPFTGSYTAIVTATNPVSTATATTTVTITPSGPWYVAPTGNDSSDCMSTSTACRRITAAIAKASSGGVIIIAAGTYIENLTIGKNLILQGDSSDNTLVNGNAAGTVIAINAGQIVTLANLTITHGNADHGGGIYNSGALALNSTKIISNSAVNFGGGIYNNGGTIIVNNSTISDNSSLAGGGIMNDGGGIMTVNRSTITGNRRANGGAIMNANGGVMTVSNSTISNNAGAAATIYSLGPITLTHSTISNNSTFGLRVGGGTARVANTILAHHTNPNCEAVAGGTIISLDYNLASDSSCNLVAAHDQPNTNPLLGPLQNNGGNTFTQALLPGSPAIDAVPLVSCRDHLGSLLTTDQRGQTRPLDGNGDNMVACDIGAYEATGQEAAPVLQVNPTSLNFSATAGGSNPAPQSFLISHSGPSPLNWAANENLSWLGLSGVSGTTPATIAASVDISGLKPGVYYGTITVSSNGVQGSPRVINVTLILNPPPSGSSINLSAEPGHSSIELTWNPINEPNVAAYRVFRAIIGGPFTTIATTDNTFYFDTDPSLVAGTTYCYQVSALRANNSLVATSNTACAVFGQVVLWIPDTWAAPGQIAIVPVNIRNASGLRIAASDIWLDFDPSVIELLNISGTPLTSGYKWSYSLTNLPPYSRARISVVASSPPRLHGDGSLFWLTFRVAGTGGAETLLNLREFINGVGGSTIYTSDDLFNPISLSLQDGIFRVANGYSLGDLNGNGVIEAIDAYIALQIASHKLTPTQQQLQAGDVNGNGRVESADASMIFYYAVHREWPSLPGATKLQASDTNSIRLSLDDVRGQPSSMVTMTLHAENLSNWAGGKFVIAYAPALIEDITNVTATGLAAGFPLQFYDDGQGLLYIALANDTPVSGTGVLMTISLRIALGAADGSSTPLTLAEVYLNDIFGRDFATSALQQTIIRDNGQLHVGTLQPGSAVYLPIIIK